MAYYKPHCLRTCFQLNTISVSPPRSLVVKKPVHVAPTVYAVTINTDELTWGKYSEYDGITDPILVLRFNLVYCFM